MNKSKNNFRYIMNNKNSYIFDSLLRISMSYYLADKKGFLIHGSGILNKSKSYVIAPFF